MLLVLLLVTVGLSVAAVDWEEISTTATPVTDQLGQPMVVFMVHLRYDAAPSRADLSYGWTVIEGSGADRVEVASFYRPTTFPGGGLNLYLSSGHVPISPGKRYVATVTVNDTENDLHFEEEIEYGAPVSLPVGIRLTAQSGDQVYDLSGIPDEEIEEMATAYDVLNDDYDVVAEEITADAFFRDHANADEDFPATVYLIPAAGLEGEFGPTTGPIRFSVERTLYIFPVPAKSDVAGLLAQLDVYEFDFVGRAFEGAGDSAVFGGRTVFVDDAAWDTLKAAADEERRR